MRAALLTYTVALKRHTHQGSMNSDDAHWKASKDNGCRHSSAQKKPTGRVPAGLPHLRRRNIGPWVKLAVAVALLLRISLPNITIVKTNNTQLLSYC
eukprot:3627191-Heterocapsa_arctica.AAC.1